MTDPVKRYRKLTGRSKRRRRPKNKRPGVPPRELALVALLLVNVLWLAFAIGGVRLWGELTGLGLSLATLFLLPRWSRGEIDPGPRPVFRLLRLPLFWLGLGLYAYFFIQTWNIAWDWTVIPDGRPRLIAVEPLVAWLPSSIESPLDENNPLRNMFFYSIPWIACCSAWAGLQTRRAVSFLLQGLALTGVAYALLALHQTFFNAEDILGVFPVIPSRVGTDIPFYGTLYNSNHAAFFLILANGLCLGLFLSGWTRDLRQFKKGGGAWLLYAGCAIICSFAVLLAQARGAIVLLGIQWLVFIVICSYFFLRNFGWRGVFFPVTVALFMAATIATFVVNPEVYERQKEEWTKTFELLENPELEARYYMSQITWDMIEDKPWLGHGAGSFRYLHFPYLAQYPEFQKRTYRYHRIEDPETGKPRWKKNLVWFQNAHVDLLEYLVEWGIVGCLFPLFMLLWLAWKALRNLKGWDTGMVTILSGVFIVLAGAAFEFHFRIPLVLLAWCLVFSMTVKLGDLQAHWVAPKP